MSNIVKLHSVPEKSADDERLCIIAQRALAPMDFPFEGLHVEAAMILNQLGLAGKVPTERRNEPVPPIAYNDEAS